MTKGNKQNGRQPPVSQVSAPSADIRCKKNASTLSTDREKICRDFIWGICIKGARCAYRHERDLDHMKTVLKFCHDYQNKGGCVRPDCTYLHTTREEQNLFLNKGRIPKVLADRYAAMAAASTSASVVVKQLTINGESMPMKSDAAVLVPGAAHQHPQKASFSQLLLQPPPPTTKVTTTVQATVQNTSTNVIPQVPKQVLKEHPPQIPAIFDISRPPPQLPQQITGSHKRAAESIEAGACKARKQEAPNVIETLCDNCVQRELRIEIIQDDNQKLQTEKDYKALLIDKNNEEIEHAKLLMKPLVKPELYQIMEEYLEKLPPDLVDPEALLEMKPTPSPMVMSSSAKVLMKHLLDSVITNGTNNVLDAQPMSNGISEDLNLSLSTSARTQPDSAENSAVELIQSLLFMYNGSIDNKPEKNQTIDKSPLDKLTSEPQPSTSSMTTSMISDLTHYLNGQDEQSLQVTNGISTPPGVVSPSHSNSIENDSNTIISFQPTVPPPAIRPMFPPPSSTNIPNTTLPNPMVLPPPTTTMRPPISKVHPPTLTVPPPKPTTQPTVSVQTHALSVCQPSKPTLAVPSPNPIIPIQSLTSQMHLPATTMPSMLSATPTEQIPKLTVPPTVPTMQSLAKTKPPTTSARQSTPIQTPVSVQGPTITQDSIVVQSPSAASSLALQQLGPAKRSASQNGKIFIPTNGHIPPRPHIFPPFQWRL